MVNIELLRQEIDNSGMTMVSIALKSGMKRETLYNRLAGTGEFTASEIAGLTDSLHLSKAKRDLIFFNPTVE